MSPIVTELTVDARGAEQGSANYIRAMRAAQAEQDKLADAEHKAALARDKQTASMLGQSASITKVRSDFERLRATTDPMFAAQLKAQKEIERATLLTDSAVKRGVTTQADATRVVDALRAKHDVLIRSVQGTGKATEFATQQAQMYAARAGTMGEVLGYLGPAGIAAAAGIGVATIAIRTLHNEATVFSADALKMREFAATVGLSTDQLQALNDVGAKFAVSDDKMGAALQRFSVQMEEFRDAQGGLFEIVRKIDPALAREMVAAKSAAEQLDLLGKAYTRAGDARNALSKVAFGRTGFDIGRVIEDAYRQGGMSVVTEEYRKSGDIIQKEMIDKVSLLRTEIDDMSKDARANFASIFSEDILEKERQYVSAWLELSRVMKNFELSSDVKRLLSIGTDAILGVIPGWGLLNQVDKTITGVGKMRPTPSPVPEGPPLPPGYLPEMQTVPTLGQLSPTALMNYEKARVAGLGEAATLTERYRLKQLELSAALDGGRITQETYNRALGAANTGLANNLLTNRISILGYEGVFVLVPDNHKNSSFDDNDSYQYCAAA